MEDLPVWKQDLPATPHKLLNDLVTLLAAFYDEHLRRDAIDGKLKPREAWELLRGFSSPRCRPTAAAPLYR